MRQCARLRATNAIMIEDGALDDARRRRDKP